MTASNKTRDQIVAALIRKTQLIEAEVKKGFERLEAMGVWPPNDSHTVEWKLSPLRMKKVKEAYYKFGTWGRQLYAIEVLKTKEKEAENIYGIKDIYGTKKIYEDDFQTKLEKIDDTRIQHNILFLDNARKRLRAVQVLISTFEIMALIRRIRCSNTSFKLKFS